MSLFADWRWMLAPMLACLILSLTHVYLGIHVVSRKVIFVDLALAQIAALGAIYAVVLGYDPHEPGDALAVALFSLAFTFVGAALFSLSRMKNERVPQEAFIGIVYAAASAAAVLILSKSPTGGEELKEMLVGDILLIPMSTIVTDVILYSAVGLFHFLFRRRFLAISLDSAGAEQAGINIRLWDLLFYMTFGVLVTRSVAIAGVLLVFSYLVIPAVIAQKWKDTIAARLYLGWTVAILGSLGGILWSFYSDYPTGPAIVMMLAAFLVVSSVTYYLRHAERPARAVLNVAAMLLVGFGFFWTLGQFGKVSAEPTDMTAASPVDLYLGELESDTPALQAEAISALAGLGGDSRVVPALTDLLDRTDSAQVVESLVEVLGELADPSAVPSLRAAASRDVDPFLKLSIATALADLDDPSGYRVMLGILDDENAGFARVQAAETLSSRAGEDFGYDMLDSSDANADALRRMEDWVRSQGG